MTDDLMGLSLDELLASLEEGQPDPTPEDGWLTTTEWARHWGCSHYRAGRAIHTLLASGRMEWSRHPRQTDVGYSKREPVYRLVACREVSGT